MSAAAKRWMSLIAQLPCQLCEHIGMGPTFGVELHHPREGHGMGQRAEDCTVIALCFEHHRGGTGFHELGKQAFEARYKTNELDLLDATIRAVVKGLASGQLRL
jgi:hypothetical protein